MKTAIRIITLAAASIFVAMSCQKETIGTQDLVKEGETIQVNIDASLGDLVAADGTKATAESVIRLKWEGAETVQVYCGTTKISTYGLTVTPSENGLFAKLTGEITTTGLTSGTSVITFVYSNVDSEQGNELAFDFSDQSTSGIPFVAYATLVYDETAMSADGETATLTDKMVEFKFATSVMKIAATNLGGDYIYDATISGINTKVTLAPSESDSPTITGGMESPAKTITTTNIDASSDGTRAIITVGLVPDNNTGRNITVNQIFYTNKGVITTDEVESNTSYTTPAVLFPCGKITGDDGSDRDYVLIAGTKWATTNVGANSKTEAGKFFAWGDINGQTPSDNNTFDPGFPVSDNYTFNPKKLPLEQDAANHEWKDPWRMPTKDEFEALKAATYWQWVEEDKGYYVYAPQSNDAGQCNYTSNTYDSSHALLFFPTAGYGEGTTLGSVGTYSVYWSSTIDSNYMNQAYDLDLSNTSIILYPANRFYGGLVRPVSD